MGEKRSTRNVLSGHVNGTAVQADIFNHSVTSHVVNTVVAQVRLQNGVSALYRILASLAGCAAVWGMRDGRSPLSVVAAVSDELGVPSGWTSSVAGWMGDRTELLENIATITFALGLLALPRLQQIGWEFADALEWRAPSTVVLSLAVLAQCGSVGVSLPTVTVFAVVAIWLARRGEGHSYSWSEHFMAAILSVLFALIFVPLYALSWLFARDVRKAT
ncbi:hypothetical protein [Streptomyces carpaticus]|uniref:Uncharacterized protein n=1 Tax=Streptomyces carpaticus TaxID=285558 RepID=A0ABV4ZH87_9ACTN